MYLNNNIASKPVENLLDFNIAVKILSSVIKMRNENFFEGDLICTIETYIFCL